MIDTEASFKFMCLFCGLSSLMGVMIGAWLALWFFRTTFKCKAEQFCPKNTANL